MQAETKAVLDAGLALPEEERRELADLLMLSLPDKDTQEEIDAAWQEEIKRRLDRHDQGLDRAIPYEEAMELIRSRRRP